MTVGTIVSLKHALLHNPVGALGVCYETYRLNGRMGFAIIFQNGEYDGFSDREAQELLEERGFSDEISRTFSFTNVLKLVQDYRRGYFDLVFGPRKVPQ